MCKRTFQKMHGMEWLPWAKDEHGRLHATSRLVANTLNLICVVVRFHYDVAQAQLVLCAVVVHVCIVTPC